MSVPIGVRRLAAEGKPAIRPIVWIGDSKQDVSALPGPVKASFGHRLHEVQEGKTPLDCKPMTAIGAGVLELRERYDDMLFVRSMW